RPGGAVAGGQRPRSLGLREAGPPPAPPREASRLAPQPDRRLRPGAAGAGGAATVARGGPCHAAPPRDARPDRPASLTGRGRWLPGGPLARRVRESGRPPAGLPALWGADGAALARRRPLC